MCSFIVLTLVIIILNNKYENEYSKNFVDNKKGEPYSLKIPLDEIDFSVYADCFQNVFELIAYNYTKKIILPCDVEYYEHKSDTKPIYVIEKGRAVYIVSENINSFPIGYGLRCWPDYEKEWRYLSFLFMEF